jgi:hypothetical protein
MKKQEPFKILKKHPLFTTKEWAHELCKLTFNKLLGSCNTCPCCEKTGDWGSIPSYNYTKQYRILLCGHCKNTIRIKDPPLKEVK